MVRRSFGCLVVLVALIVAAAPAMAKVAGLSATVDFDKAMVLRTERPVVTVAIANNSAADVYLVRWQTPFQGIVSNIFEVRRGGVPVEYTGMLAKRLPAGPSDYLLIPAGAERRIRLDLSKVYDFSRSGEYTVQYKVALQDALRDATPAAIRDFAELASNVAAAGVERDDNLPRFGGRVTAAAASNAFVKCDASQQTSIALARTNALGYANDSLSYLNANKTGTRYTKWFGTVTSSRYSTVTTHYVNEGSVFQNAAMTFYCNCHQKNVYAFVYPDRAYEVHLCPVFWQTTDKGTDSRAGTLVHETSHFTVVAGTDDWAYGQTACSNLAISDPNKAVDNADSHEYFAENNPPGN